MNELWSFCNKWLRSQADLPLKRRSTLIYCMLPPSELALVLETIRLFEVRMNSGKAQVEVMLKPDKHDGTIEIFVGDSKEMSS